MIAPARATRRPARPAMPTGSRRSGAAMSNSRKARVEHGIRDARTELIAAAVIDQRRVTEPVQLPDVAAALDRACEKLRDSTRILLTSHRRPDGDGTGSMSGLASLLRAQGKEAVIYSVDPIARRYKWLPLVPTV